MNKKVTMNKDNKTNNLVCDAGDVRVSIFWKVFSQVNTVCTATIRYKGIGKKAFYKVAKRNREAGDEYNEAIGIELSGRRVIKELKRKARSLDNQADKFLKEYFEYRKYSVSLSNAAYDLEEKLDKGLEKNTLVARES